MATKTIQMLNEELSNSIEKKHKELLSIREDLSSLEEIQKIFGYLNAELDESDKNGFLYVKYGLLDKIPGFKQFERGQELKVYNIKELPSSDIVVAEIPGLEEISPVVGYICSAHDQHGWDFEQKILALTIKPQLGLRKVASYKDDREARSDKEKTNPLVEYDKDVKFYLNPLDNFF